MIDLGQQLQDQANEHRRSANLLEQAASAIRFQRHILNNVRAAVTMRAPLGQDLNTCLLATEDFPWFRFTHNDRILSGGEVVKPKDPDGDP